MIESVVLAMFGGAAGLFLAYWATQALVMLVAAVFIVVNFLVDLAYAWIDPRIRFR